MNYFHINLRRLVSKRVRLISPPTLWPPGYSAVEVAVALPANISLAAAQELLEKTAATVFSHDAIACEAVPLRTLPTISRGIEVVGEEERVAEPAVFPWAPEPPAEKVIGLIVIYSGPEIEVDPGVDLTIRLVPTEVS
jgi:hypothetical protein